MKTCAGTLALGALCLVILAIIVGVILTPAGAQVIDAGLFTSLGCLVGPIVLVIGIAAVGVAQNEPKQVTGGWCSVWAIGMVIVVIAGIFLLVINWTGG